MGPSMSTHSAAIYPWIYSLGRQWLSSILTVRHFYPRITGREWVVGLGRRDHLHLRICPLNPRSLEQGRRGILWIRCRACSGTSSPWIGR